jgi:tRNA dimethylallyltransferase
VDPFLIAVMGPTASGKTELAERLADRLDALLVNADAFQIYRGMDIGTGKPENRNRYALLDIRNPNESFGVGEWVQHASGILQDAYSQGRSVITVGGTGLNVRALFEEYSGMMSAPNPELRKRLNDKLEREGLPSLVQELEMVDKDVLGTIDLANPMRVIRAIERLQSTKSVPPATLPPFVRKKLALDVPVEEIDGRIENRVRQMMQNGWAQEIERLREDGYSLEDPGFRAIGYRTMWEVVKGALTENEAVEKTTLETRRYAKRQRTWLRSEPHLLRIDARSGADTYGQAMHFIALD